MKLQIKPELLAMLQRVVLSGERLDALAKHHGLTRKRILWIFKESDSTLLARVIAKVKNE